MLKDSPIKQLRELTQELDKQESYIHDLKDEYLAFMLSCPLPCWFRSVKEGKTYINKAYSHEFGIPKKVYHSNELRAVWSSQICAAWQKMDDQVIKTGKSEHYSTKIYHPRLGDTQSIQVTLWPLMLDECEPVMGVAGMITSHIGLQDAGQ